MLYQFINTWEVESMVNIKIILDSANLANAHKLQLDKIEYCNIIYNFYLIEEHEWTNASLYDLSKLYNLFFMLIGWI